jgi:hypothetical protein
MKKGNELRACKMERRFCLRLLGAVLGNFLQSQCVRERMKSLVCLRREDNQAGGGEWVDRMDGFDRLDWFQRQLWFQCGPPQM